MRTVFADTSQFSPLIVRCSAMTKTESDVKTSFQVRSYATEAQAVHQEDATALRSSRNHHTGLSSAKIICLHVNKERI